MIIDFSPPVIRNDYPVPDLAVVKGEIARRSFHAFLRLFAWPVLFPATPFLDNWHIHAICEHLEAVHCGQIKRLIINLPYRSLKSTIISQAFPAWEWIDAPHIQFLTSSYAKDLATRDAVNSRKIIESDSYQESFGCLFSLTSDQNVKTRYENDKSGTRTVTSTDSSATGFGGNRILVDDPLNVKKADSEVERSASIEWWRGTMATRFNNPSEDAAVLTHQRVNELDLTGYCLAEEKGWEHLVLPMRYEPEFTKTTSLGFHDPRTVEGELLQPSRLNEEAVAAMEHSLGKYHTQAQLQQRPEPRGGVIFNRADWKYYTLLPQMDEYVLSLDCSFKDLKTSDYVALHVWGRKGGDKYLMYRRREQLGFGATCALLRSVHALFPYAVAKLVEDKANGTAVIETLTSEIPGIIAINPEGGKVARAFAMQPEHEAGNLYLPDPSVDPDIETLVGCAASFPSVPNDDEIDAMTQAINWYRTRERTMGLFSHIQQQVAAKKAAEFKEQQ